MCQNGVCNTSTQAAICICKVHKYSRTIRLIEHRWADFVCFQPEIINYESTKKSIIQFKANRNHIENKNFYGRSPYSRIFNIIIRAVLSIVLFFYELLAHACDFMVNRNCAKYAPSFVWPSSTFLSQMSSQCTSDKEGLRRQMLNANARVVRLK